MTDAAARQLVYAGWLSNADRRVIREAKALFYDCCGTLDQLVRVYCELVNSVTQDKRSRNTP